RDLGPFRCLFGVIAVFGVNGFGASADRVEHGAGAAAAAADEADLYLEVVARGGVDVWGAEGRDCRSAGDGGGLEEIASGNGGSGRVIRIVHWILPGRSVRDFASWGVF